MCRLCRAQLGSFTSICKVALKRWWVGQDTVKGSWMPNGLLPKCNPQPAVVCQHRDDVMDSVQAQNQHF